MYIDLVESLRCVRDHEPTWLVAVADRIDGRDIVSGVLGCPECRAEYPIADGVAWFTPADIGSAVAAPPEVGRADEEIIVRAAALLNLTTPGGFAVLAGAWSAAALGLLALADGVHVLALNAPPGLVSGGGLSLAVALGDVPVRPSTTRGVALDAANASPQQVAAAAAALRTGGRLVAPASVPVPTGVNVLARDERHWVGERRAPSGPVVHLTLTRGGGR